MTFHRFLAAQLRRPSGVVGRLVVAPMLNVSNRRMMRAAVETLQLQDAHCVLDIGFGGGLALKLMLDQVHGGRVYGVDPAGSMVTRARRRFAKPIREGRLKLLEGDVQELPFPPKTFDRVCTVNTIYFWADPEGAFREIRRVLKDDGDLVVALGTRAQMQDLPYTAYGFALYSPDEVLHLLLDAGFDHGRIDHPDERRGERFVLVVGRTWTARADNAGPS